MRGHFLSLFLLFSFLSLISVNTTKAGEWRISPIRIKMSAQDKSSSITVFNEDKVSLNFQVKAMEWTQQENGKDVYVDSEDIIFFPKVFTLEAGKERLIRIGLKAPTPVKEKTYRLFVEEIPSQQNKEGVAVQIALRFGIPIFVKPLKEDTKWEITKKMVSNSIFHLQMENKSNHHLQVHYIRIKGYAGEKEVFSNDIKGWYVLSGSKRLFSGKLEECSKIDKILFQVVTDRFTFDDKIDISKEVCSP